MGWGQGVRVELQKQAKYETTITKFCFLGRKALCTVKWRLKFMVLYLLKTLSNDSENAQ